jgi:hypothetical protein
MKCHSCFDQQGHMTLLVFPLPYGITLVAVWHGRLAQDGVLEGKLLRDGGKVHLGAGAK